MLPPIKQFVYFLVLLIKPIWVSEASHQMVIELSSVWFWFKGHLFICYLETKHDQACKMARTHLGKHASCKATRSRL